MTEIENQSSKGDWTQLKNKLVNWKSDLKKLSKCIYKMRDCKFGQWNKKSNIHVIRIL